MALCPSATMIRPTAPTPTPRSWLREGRSPRKAVSQAESNAPTMRIQILSFNNFHGEPRAAKRVQRLHHHRSQDRPRRGHGCRRHHRGRGIECVATHLRDARNGNPNTVTMAAGDIVGVSPLLSAAFHADPRSRR
jgi:5'-nucleotidase